MLEREARNCAFFAKSERDTDRANCNASPPREIFYFCASWIRRTRSVGVHVTMNEGYPVS